MAFKPCSVCLKEYDLEGKRTDFRFWRSLLEIHHIIPKSYGGGEGKNRILLCRSCHGEIHRIYARVAIEKAYGADPLFFNKCLEFLYRKKNGLD